jgi:ATP-dependent helicase/nuclease subunit B
VFTLVDAGSGQARLAAAEAFVLGFPAGSELLLVGATRDAIDDLVRGLTPERGATFGLHRFSLTQLAAQLAAVRLAEQGVAPASGLGTEVLAAHCAFEAEREGALEYFSPVVQLPGFGRALARTLSELRLARIDAAALAPLGPRGADLGRLLARFDARLRASRVADRAALFETATQALRDGTSGHAGRPLLLLDLELGSPVERDFVSALCAGAPVVLATVPAGDELAHAALLRLRAEQRSPASAVGAYRPIAGLEPASPAPAPAPAPAPVPSTSLERLRVHLFSESTPEAAELDPSVRVFSAPGEARESVEIARYLLDEARAGVPFDQMAVLVRNPEAYAPLLQTAFRRAGIPAYFARGTRLPDPAGRALLALLATRAEGLSAQRFAEYLSFAQTPLLDDEGEAPAAAPEWTAPTDDALGSAAGNAPDPELDDAADHAAQDAAAGSERELRAPWRWEALLVDAAVIGTEERWRRRLLGLANELALRAAELERIEPDSPALPVLRQQRTELERLRRFALPVIEQLAALPERASWGSWLAALNALVPRVLRRPERVLRVLAELAPLAEVGPVRFDEVQSVLAERLGLLERDPPAQRYGRVFVAGPELARGRSFARVFVPGLAERMFPQRPREDPLLLDPDRARLSPELCTQLERGQRERLLLRLAVSAARERLYLSYPRVETVEGRPRVTSFYGLDVARAVSGTIPDPEEYERRAADEAKARLAWPAPPEPSRAIDAVEHDLASLWPLLHPAKPGSDAMGRARYLLELNPHLGRSLRSRFARWERRRWTEHDGLVRRTPEIEAALDARRLGQRAYSVSALERYAVCPYKFLLSAGFGLSPRKSLAPSEPLDPLTRGNLVHRVQAETLRALAERELLPLDPERLAAADALLDEVLARVAEEFRDRLEPPIRRVWDDELAALRSDLAEWLRHTAEASARWQPQHCELGFGLLPGEGRDPASRREPVVLEHGALLRGCVDLVERSGDGSVRRVTDYKTGAVDTKEGLIVAGGERLQPVLYGLAVETGFGVPVAESRLFYCTTRGGFSERVVPLDLRAREAGKLVLRVIDNAIAGGFLPPAPRKDACARCDYRAVCGPYEEERAQRKDQAPLAPLKDLRGLP